MRRLLVALAVLAMSASAYAGPIAGNTSGVFVNPAGGPSLVVTGVGTNTLTWGEGNPPPPNSVSFTGLAFVTDTETLFKLGDFDYYNGTVTSGTSATGFDLLVNILFTLPTGVSESFTFPIAVISTINTGDPEGDADILTLAQLYSVQTFMYDGVTYQVHLEGWRNANVAAGFVVGNNEFHVYENSTGSAELWGQVTSEIINPVPDPGSTLLLFGLSVAGLRAWQKRWQ